MKVAAISTAVIAALATSAFAAPSFAQDYRGYGYDSRDPCQERVHNSGTTGALLGGLAGVLIGSNLASHHGGRAGGAVLGGLAGAAVGNNIARSSAHSSGACEGGYYNSRYTPRARYDGRYDTQRYQGRYEAPRYEGRYETQRYAPSPYRYTSYDGGDYGSYRPY
jgi:uncharacterized protein YcfJ